MKFVFLVSILFFINTGTLLSEESKNNSELNNLIEMQNKTLETMQKSLPKLPTMFDAISKMGETIGQLEDNRHKRIREQNSELDLKIEEVLKLIEKKSYFKAKIKALNIHWNNVGLKSVDDEKKAHFDSVRKEMLDFIDKEKQ